MYFCTFKPHVPREELKYYRVCQSQVIDHVVGASFCFFLNESNLPRQGPLYKAKYS